MSLARIWVPRPIGPIPPTISAHLPIRAPSSVLDKVRAGPETIFVLFDVSVARYLDRSYVTASNANYIMHACLTGIAMRRGGVRDPAWPSTLPVGSVKEGKAARRR